jgi:hypothetical protein
VVKEEDVVVTTRCLFFLHYPFRAVFPIPRRWGSVRDGIQGFLVFSHSRLSLHCSAANLFLFREVVEDDCHGRLIIRSAKVW